MIVLSDVHLKFDRTLVENGRIIIPDNKITVITGKSGTGKTSLLYLIGLMSSNEKYEYIFDGRSINIKSDTEIASIRKKEIGYVFQENSLVESLSIADNIKCSAKIAGYNLTDVEITKYLHDVSLDIDAKKYPRVLSGGERQRLAIACAMAKKPAIIVADEPTSALDAENSNLILKILQDFAKKNNNKVVVASHNDLVRDNADVVYEIENSDIVLKRGSCDDKGKSNAQTVKSKAFSFLSALKYALKTMKRSKFLRAVMVILCSISIALAACISGIGDGLVEHQKTLLKNISDREVFLINFTAPLQTYLDVDENLSIPDGDAERISEISSIEAYYPYLEFRSTGYDFDNDTMFDSCEMHVASDTDSKTYSFGSNIEGYSNVIVAPYYNEEDIAKRVDVPFDSRSENKIYVSHELASSIGLLDGQHSKVHISADFGIPVGTTPVDLNVSETDSSYKADIDVSTKRQMEFDVAGILDHDFSNRRSASGNVIIYMPIQTMLDLVSEAKSDVNIEDAHKDYELNEWKPSAYVSYVKDFNDVTVTIEKLEKISPNFKAVSGYQDVDSMNEMLGNVKHTASWIIVAVLIIVFTLMAVIYINNTVGRKYEFALLKANGLNSKEVLGIALSEAILQFVGIFLIASLAALIISRVVNLLFSFDVMSFSATTLIIIGTISLLAVLAPTVGSIIVMNRVKPDRLLRN